MAFPELPDDRRARPRRYRGSDVPERPGRRRAPEDPPPAGGEPGGDEQRWLLGTALQHGVPARDGFADGEPEGAPRGVRTRHAGPEDGADEARPRGRRYRNGFDELAAGRSGRHGVDAGGPLPEERSVPATEGPDTLRARYAARLNRPDASEPGAAPNGRPWPPPGSRPEQAPGPRHPAPPAGRPEGTGRHGVRPGPDQPAPDGRPGRRASGFDPSAAPSAGFDTSAAPPFRGPDAPRRNGRPPAAPGFGPSVPAPGAPDGHAPRGHGVDGYPADGRAPEGHGPDGYAPGGHGRPDPRGRAPGRPAGRGRSAEDADGARPEPRPDGAAPGRRPVGPPVDGAAPTTRRPVPPDADGATTTRRPAPPDPDAAATTRRRVPPEADPRRARAAAAPVGDDVDVDAGTAAGPYPGADAPARPPRRRRPAVAPAEPAEDPDVPADPQDASDEPERATGGRAARRSGPVGVGGRIAALTGRGSATAAAGDEKPKTAFWKEILLLAGVAILLTVLIQTFLAKVYVIPSGSMETTLHGCTGCNNDRVLVDKVTYNFTDITPGDIVVFRGTDGWASETYSGEGSENPLLKGLQSLGSLVGIAPPDEKDFVKRVIAVGGQTVSCCDALNQVVVDGQPLEEPYIYYLPEAGPARQIPFGPITVPEGQYWMMGDSRNNSADSRAAGHGPIPEANIIGKVRLIVLPFDRFGWVSAVDPQTTAEAAGLPGLPGGVPLALGILGTLPLAAGRRRALLARAEAERFLPATRPPHGWRRRA